MSRTQSNVANSKEKPAMNKRERINGYAKQGYESPKYQRNRNIRTPFNG